MYVLICILIYVYILIYVLYIYIKYTHISIYINMKPKIFLMKNDSLPTTCALVCEQKLLLKANTEPCIILNNSHMYPST